MTNTPVYIVVAFWFLIAGCGPKEQSGESLPNLISEHMEIDKTLRKSEQKMREIYFFYGVQAGMIAEGQKRNMGEDILTTWQRAYAIGTANLQISNSGVGLYDYGNGVSGILPNSMTEWHPKP